MAFPSKVISNQQGDLHTKHYFGSFFWKKFCHCKRSVNVPEAKLRGTQSQTFIAHLRTLFGDLL